MIEVVPLPFGSGVKGCLSLGGKPRIGVTAANRKRVFLLDVNPLCYAGSRPRLECLGEWLWLLFGEVSLSDPVIGVVDGENGTQWRRRLLPSYKAHRPWSSTSSGFVGRSLPVVGGILGKCGVPVVRVEGEEADDVIATLCDQALEKGFKVVIASPDKDFKQLLSERVQMVMPLSDLKRWSFYTLHHYASQHRNSHPRSDLSLRCLLGDAADGVPGIQDVAPGFGRKTAIKLLSKHGGSLEKLLSAASVRSVAKQYAQEALVKHADYLRRNYQLLSLRSDVDVRLLDHWLSPRDSKADHTLLTAFLQNR